MSECKSCGAEIIWAEIDGKRIPLNQRRVRAYEEHKGVWSCLKPGDLSDLHPAAEGPQAKYHLVHISHFITCPNASEHSRGKT